MAPLERSLSWYKSWVIDTPESPSTTARAHVARELLEAIQSRNYDNQTLKEIILVLDHECLHRVRLRLNNLHKEEDIAIGTPVIGDFAEQLLGCLVQHINPSSHLLRELQCRALLSVLALLQLDGVREIQTDVHTRWQNQIKERFRDLVSLPGESTGFSTNTYLRVQCSHLLSLGAAYYAQQFVGAELRCERILDLASSVMQLGVMGVNIALGFGIMGNFSSTLKDLDDNLTGLVQSPNNGYQDLFKLQSLTRIALALQFYSRIGIKSAESHERCDHLYQGASRCSHQIAHQILVHVLQILNSENNKSFETRVRPPRKFHEQASALFNHGPARMSKFQYFFGLLDCASQLGCIVDPKDYPVGFAARVRLIIANSEEAIFRLKAMEVLLINNNLRRQQIEMILASSRSSPETQTQLQAEINIICGQSRHSLSPPAATPEVWMFPPMENSDHKHKLITKIEHFHIPLPCGTIFNRTRFSTAGLSPLCSHAYFLNEDMIFIYSLSRQGRNLEEPRVFRRRADQTKFNAAALSEKFLAVLLKKSIQIYRYDRYDGQVVGSDTFGIERNGCQWNQNSLLSIHETKESTWIAVGGSTKEDGILTGSIKMYSVEENGNTASLRGHPISFTRLKPNPLALDFLKTLAFSPDGERLVCATNNNRVLIWRLSNHGAPHEAPFIIKKDLSRDIRGGEISSTSIFNSPNANPYVFCTTTPSIERVINQGEWSFISPVGSASVHVCNSLVHDLTQLKECGSILTGAVSPQGDAVALVEYQGKGQSRVLIMPVVAKDGGGLSTLNYQTLSEANLVTKENERIKISPTAIRFHESDIGLYLVAVDVKGMVVKGYFGE